MTTMLIMFSITLTAGTIALTIDTVKAFQKNAELRAEMEAKAETEKLRLEAARQRIKELDAMKIAA